MNGEAADAGLLNAIRPYSIEEHFGWLASGLAWTTSAIELLAIAIMLTGLLRFASGFLRGELRAADDRAHRLNGGRIELGRYLLSGLEVFIVADLIRVVLSPSLESLAFLAAVVVIRSVISFFLERDIASVRREEGR